jgi:hypothetical protein
LKIEQELPCSPVRDPLFLPRTRFAAAACVRTDDVTKREARASKIQVCVCMCGRVSRALVWRDVRHNN